MTYVENRLQWTVNEGVYCEYLNSLVNQEKVIRYKGHLLLPYAHEEGYLHFLDNNSKLDFCYLNLKKSSDNVEINKNNVIIPPDSSITFNVSKINYSSYKGLYQVNVSSQEAMFELRVNNRVVQNYEILKKYNFNNKNFTITIKNISQVTDLKLTDLDIVLDKDTSNRNNKVHIPLTGVLGVTDLFNDRKEQFNNDIQNTINGLAPKTRQVNGYTLNKDFNLSYDDVGAYSRFVTNKVSVTVDLKVNFLTKNEIVLVKSNNEYYDSIFLKNNQIKDRITQLDNIDFHDKFLKKVNVIKSDNLQYLIKSVESSIINDELMIVVILENLGSSNSSYPRLKIDLEYFSYV